MSTNYIAPTWRMPRNANNTPVDKLSNYSIDFDGVASEYIDCGLDGTGTGSSEFALGSDLDLTISFWFKFSNITSSDGCVSWATTPTAGGTVFLFAAQNSDKLGVWVENNWRYESSSLTADQWYNFTATRSSLDNTWRFYLDNGTPATWSDGGTLTRQTYATNFYLGSGFGGSGGYEGSLAQCTVFNYVLSENQRNYLYSLNNPMAIDGVEPIAYWPLGDNANPIATAGYPNLSVGADSVFEFDSSGQRINLGLESNLNLGGSSKSSTSLWFKKVSNSTSCLYGYNYGDINGSGYYFWLQSGAFRVKVGKDGETAGFPYGYYQISSSNLPIGEWINIIVVFDGTLASGDDRIKVYQNGEVATGTYANGTNFPATLSTGTSAPPRNVYLGQLQLGGGGFSYNYDGELSNVQQWDTDLSLTDANTLYNNGIPLFSGTQPEEANLRGWYKLNQSANWEAGTTGNWQIPDAVSAYPQSFEFDGGSNEMTLPKGSMSDDESKSVSVWIKNEITAGTDYVFNSRSGGYLANGISLIQTTTEGFVYNNSNGSKINTGYQTALHIPNDGQWHHIAWTSLPSTQTLKVYIDGIFVFEQIGATIVDTTPSTNINVGQSGSPWTGKLSNFQVWDDVILSDGGVALNDPATGQIAELYNNGVPLPTASVEPSSLKTWYKLDEPTSIWDETNWSIENQKYPANYTSALDFVSADSDYINLSNNSSLYPGTGDVSYSAWIKPSSTTGFKAIFGVQSLSTASKGVNIQVYNGEIWVFVGVGVSGQWGVNTGGSTGGGGFITSGANLTLNEWHHIAFTFDRDGDGVIYINGAPNRTAAANPNNYSSVDITGTANVFLGKGDGYFDGEISNAATFNTSLDAAAVSTLFNSGTPEINISSSPISWWKLDNATTVIQDSAGSNNGTNNGTTEVNTFVSTLNGTSSGMTAQNLVNNNVSTLNGESSGMDTTNLVQSNISKQIPFSSYSVYFDGIGDTFGIPDAAVLKPQNITVSMWLKGGSQASTYRYPLAKYYAGTGPAYGFSTGNTLTNIRFLVRNGNDTAFDYVPSTVAVMDSNWHHIVGILNGTALSLYIDGVLDNTATAASSGITYGSGDLTIGAFQASSLEYFGDQSNVAIWDSPLNADDVLNLYNNGVPQDLSNFRIQPVAWYPMDQSYTYFNGSDLVARDVISGNDGVGVNIGQEKIIGNAPGSEANGTGTNLDLSDLIGDMKDSKLNSYSINMADYADGVVNPANSGRSTEVPEIP